MSSVTTSNVRIAKNTLALYFRQIIILAVSLFTARIVLQALGVTDYGINNVVGGVVLMFGFLSTTLTSITQRFISVELGKGSTPAVLQRIFSTSIILHAAAGIIVIILAETVGLWFLNNKLVIPAERVMAANWVYQFAVFGFLISLLSAPFTALIISHEDMHIYAYMGIFDAAARLAAVYLLVIINADKLMFWALCGLIISAVLLFFYFIYCRKKYQEARFTFVYDNILIKKLSGFGGYVFADNIFLILLHQGTNILINIFFGPVVNAAKGLANAVSTALLSFGSNFHQAIIPQITMACAAKNNEAMWSLVERGTRMLYFLFLAFSVPILLETEFVLKLWLKNVPEYTVIFTRLLIINALIETFLATFWCVVRASGKLKAAYYSAYTLNVLTFVLCYLACRAGQPPYYVFIILSLLRFLSCPYFFALAKKIYNFPIRAFIKKALFPIFCVSAASFLPFYAADKLFPESMLRSGLVIMTSILWTGIVIVLIGFRKNERTAAIAFVKRKFSAGKNSETVREPDFVD